MTSNHIPQRAIGAKKNIHSLKEWQQRKQELLANTLQTQEEEINISLMIQIYQNSKLTQKYLNFRSHK